MLAVAPLTTAIERMFIHRHHHKSCGVFVHTVGVMLMQLCSRCNDDNDDM